MGIEFIYPEFEVIRNEDRCTVCRACERQCANEVHSYDEELGVMKCDESKMRKLPAVRFLLSNQSAEDREKPTALSGKTPTGRTIRLKRSISRQTAEAFFFLLWAIPSPSPFTGIKY